MPAVERSRPAAPVRIVHLGVGNFMRAHLAWYTAHARDAAAWGIAAFTGRTPQPPHGLAAQDGVYTLTTRGPEGDRTELIESLSAVHGRADHADWLRYWRDPQVRIVTLTITEAGYRFDSDDSRHLAEVAALRRDSSVPVGSAVARLVAGILARRAAGAGGIALLPCDNLPDNGAVLAAAVTACAVAVDPASLGWIAENVTFAGSVVDRITPAVTGDVADVIRARTGTGDLAPVVTEPFAEWIIARGFPRGRPSWAAMFVDDLRPYEQRKLWLLNGAHSLLAYTGLARGHETVAQAVGDTDCRRWVRRWWTEAARHLSLDSDDVADYCLAITVRFANPAMQHSLRQIAVDGAEKLRARIVPVLLAERQAGRTAEAACHVIGAWIAYLRRATDVLPDAHAATLAGLIVGDLNRVVRDVSAWLSPLLAEDDVTHRAVVASAEACAR